MEEKDRTLGLRSVVSISVGLVIATSCLVSLGQGAGSIGVVFIGAMVIACLLNMTTVASLSELNALMPNTTGGLAQYTLACMGPFPTLISMVGGYLICNIMSSGVEASIFCLCYGIYHSSADSKPDVHLHYDSSGYDSQPVRCGYVCQDPGSGSISSGRFHADPWSDRYAGTWYWGSGASALQYGYGF